LRDGSDTQSLHQTILSCLGDRSIVNSREVGSEVRRQAIETSETIVEATQSNDAQRVEIFARVYGLAVEKLDKMIQGLITSASSGGEALLSAARLAIGKFIVTNSSTDVEMFYDNLLAVIRGGMPNKQESAVITSRVPEGHAMSSYNAARLLKPGLEVLAFLLDVDNVPRFPQSIKWKGLLDVMARLRKNSDLRTLETIIQVYTGLARYESLRADSTSALQYLLVNRRFPTTYYNVIKGGQFLFKIQYLHQKYGPVVRIGPNEVHINDPDFYDQIYSLKGRWDKDAAFVNQFDNTDSAFGTIHHDLHRIRRRAFQNFFSKQNITSLEPLIQTIVSKLCRRLERFAGTNKEVPLRHAYECLTNDIVMEYTLGKSDHSVEHPDFNPALHETIKLLGKSGHYMKLIPGIQGVLPFVPPSLITFLVPAMAPIVALQKSLTDLPCQQCNALASSIIYSAPFYDAKPRAHPTVCHEIYYSDELPPSEKTLRRMQHEIETFVVAGTETTAHALACITFYILNDPIVLGTLEAELFDVGDVKALKLQQLQQLPYLTSVILEGLRLSYGVATRLPRIAPERVIRYGNYVIPAGTPVSMSSMLIHHNESIFPSPVNYDPQRWMGPGQRQRLEKYLVNFSKGTRHLAMAELYITIATVFSKFDLELFETTREDVTLFR
ncbi:MAG: hypothetical protein LQ338_007987, partial [Usnochroma carphineum]